MKGKGATLTGSMPVPLRWWMRTAAGSCSEKKSHSNAPDGKYNEDHGPAFFALEKREIRKDLVTASANAVAQPKVHLGMHEGEGFYLGDLLYSLMPESHNDSAVAIEEHLCRIRSK